MDELTNIINNSLPKKYYGNALSNPLPENFLYNGDCEEFLDHAISLGLKFNLIFTSPPYNLGKQYKGYADNLALQEYITWQERIIQKCYQVLTDNGSICWQVGNFVNNGHIIPLDMEMAPIFKGLNLKLRNRVVWHFGHGLHCSRRFSGRYEVVLWYTKSDSYVFNLDQVRIKAKYPNKKHFKGPKKGQLSGNPLGKNPADIWKEEDFAIEDIWDIPNVKHNHVEKTDHPCQFPVGLVQRFIKALTNKGDSVFDPFLGVGTTAATAAIYDRHFYGCELDKDYFFNSIDRVKQAINGELAFRDSNKPIYQPTNLKK